LRFENFEVRNSETTTVVDLGEVDLNCWFQEVDLGHPFRSIVKIVRSTVTSHCGGKRCSIFKKSRGQAAIKTRFLAEGHVVARGELWGKKQFGSKPLLGAPAIVWLRKVIAQGHVVD
jgi:hypothetical protein